MASISRIDNCYVKWACGKSYFHCSTVSQMSTVYGMCEGHDPGKQASWHVQVRGSPASSLCRLAESQSCGSLAQAVKMKYKGKERPGKNCTGKGEKKKVPRDRLWGHCRPVIRSRQTAI